MVAGGTRKILIVDDEQFILDAVSSMLATAGFETHTCHLWAGVANIVRNHEPDLILLDYNMPGLRGDDICSILKRNATGAALKIIIYSAEDEADLVRIVSDCGADGYIRKNTPGPELLRMIDAALGLAN